jgi:hypothetical protein
MACIKILCIIDTRYLRISVFLKKVPQSNFIVLIGHKHAYFATTICSLHPRACSCYIDNMAADSHHTDLLMVDFNASRNSLAYTLTFYN